MRHASERQGLGVRYRHHGARSAVVIEHFVKSEDVHKRWTELQERFKGEGWWGPSVSQDSGPRRGHATEVPGVAA